MPLAIKPKLESPIMLLELQRDFTNCGISYDRNMFIAQATGFSNYQQPSWNADYFKGMEKP